MVETTIEILIDLFHSCFSYYTNICYTNINCEFFFMYYLLQKNQQHNGNGNNFDLSKILYYVLL